MTWLRSGLPLAVAVIATFGPGAMDSRAAPVEVGTVDWRRDLDGALAESDRTGKPVFAFFQEVPGCAGCKKFGAEVMSHALITEAIRHEFLPVLIYNNRGGRDAEILKRFEEPSWNYQVIRFLDGKGNDLLPRKDRIWTRDALASRMILALEAAGRPAPRYLEAAAYESADHEQVAFAQPCFWTGEMLLGRIPGVIGTEAGWIEGREVTLVRYLPDLVPVESLVDRAVEAGVAGKVYVTERKQLEPWARERNLPVGTLDSSYSPAGESDQKRQIRSSILGEIDLSPMQATKVNAFAPVDLQQALAWLTPRQRAEIDRRGRQGRGPLSP